MSDQNGAAPDAVPVPMTVGDRWDAQAAARFEAAQNQLRDRQNEEHAVHVIADRVRRKADDALAIGRDPRPINVAQAEPPAEDEPWLVEGLIRPGKLVLLSGPPSVAKSWIRVQLEASAGSGMPAFLDRYGLRRRLRILVLDEDNGRDEEYRREEAMLAHLELLRDDLDTVHRISLAGVQLDQLAWQQWLRGLIVELELDLLIIDPISETHGGKELRDDPAFAALRRFLKQLKTDFPATAVVAVHHTRKLPSAERYQERGLEDVRGQWGQTPDAVIVMSPLGDSRVRWTTHKRVPRTSLILEQLASGPFRVVADDQVRKPSTDDRLLAAIDAGAETIDEVRIATDIPRSTLFDALKRLRRAGILEPTGELRRSES
jgi:hypothetical protein